MKKAKQQSRIMDKCDTAEVAQANVKATGDYRLFGASRGALTDLALIYHSALLLCWNTAFYLWLQQQVKSCAFSVQVRDWEHYRVDVHPSAFTLSQEELTSSGWCRCPRRSSSWPVTCRLRSDTRCVLHPPLPPQHLLRVAEAEEPGWCM